MSASMLRADDADKQRAFLGLLASPSVTPWTDSSLYGLVHRHAHTLNTWCKRLGYQLAHLDQCYRLRRVPIDAQLSAPHRAHPGRAELLLTLYAAISLDDHREDSITLQELSDVVRLSAAGRSGWPYDPDRRAHRKLFLEALRRLVGHGVLEERTEVHHLEAWERSGEGIGAGYIIHRDALVLLIDAGDVELALEPRNAETEDTRGRRLLRSIIETPALYIDELDEPDRAYLVSQLSRLVSLTEEMTGGNVEVRSDAVVLSLAPDRALPDSLLMGFPDATSQDWAALAMIDRIVTSPGGTGRSADAAEVLRHARELHGVAKAHLSKELRESPTAIVESVSNRLGELGLLRIDDDGCWSLTPLAARYRAAELDFAHPSVPQSTLPEEGP